MKAPSKIFTLVALLLVPLFLASVSNSVFANSLPDVSNVRAEGATIVWDPLPEAAGYNVYAGARVGSQQGQAGFQYVTTVIGSNSYQPSETLRAFKIVAFSEGGAVFSDLASATTVYIPDSDIGTQAVNMTFYNDSIGRYLVTNNCGNTDSECVARCDHNGNAGNATGGFCNSASQYTIQSVGTQLTYRCSAIAGSGTTTITAGVYCAP